MRSGPALVAQVLTPPTPHYHHWIHMLVTGGGEMPPSVVIIGQQTKSPGPWSGGGAADRFTKLNTHMPRRRRIRNVRGPPGPAQGITDAGGGQQDAQGAPQEPLAFTVIFPFPRASPTLGRAPGLSSSLKSPMSSYGT